MYVTRFNTWNQCTLLISPTEIDLPHHFTHFTNRSQLSHHFTYSTNWNQYTLLISPHVWQQRFSHNQSTFIKIKSCRAGNKYYLHQLWLARAWGATHAFLVTMWIGMEGVVENSVEQMLKLMNKHNTPMAQLKIATTIDGTQRKLWDVSPEITDASVFNMTILLKFGMIQHFLKTWRNGWNDHLSKAVKKNRIHTNHHNDSSPNTLDSLAFVMQQTWLKLEMTQTCLKSYQHGWMSNKEPMACQKLQRKTESTRQIMTIRHLTNQIHQRLTSQNLDWSCLNYIILAPSPNQTFGRQKTTPQRRVLRTTPPRNGTVFTSQMHLHIP